LADVRAGFGLVALVLAVDRFIHTFDEQAIVILGEERVPVAAPDDLNHVPAGAVEGGIEFLDDLAVAPHRSVEPLQGAVDDEDEVVEDFPRGERKSAERFWLVGFAVANEAPDAPR